MVNFTSPESWHLELKISAYNSDSNIKNTGFF